MRILGIAGALIVGLLLPISLVPGRANGSATASISCPITSPNVGSTFVSEITIDVGSTPLGSYTLVITFNPTVVTIMAIAGGTTTEFSGPPAQNSSQFSSGMAIISAINDVSLTSPVGLLSVAKVTFKAGNSSGCSALGLNVTVVSDPNGNPITTTPSGCDACVIGATALDHFECYKVARAVAPVGQPPFPMFTPRQGVVVVDAFSTMASADEHEVDATKPLDVCNPANKNGEDPTAPTHAAHLEAYAIKLSKLVPPQPKFSKSIHTIQNQLGTLKLNVTAIASLLVPSAKVLGTGGAPPLGTTSLDHFKCYKSSVAKAPKGQPPYPRFTPTTVTVTDEFGGPLQVTLTKPTSLCLPADKNGEDPTAPAHGLHLVCYAAKLTRTVPPQPKFTPTPISTNNQFGNEVQRAKSLDMLCVPSARLD